MHKTTPIAAVLALAPLTSVASQRQPPLEPGERVRVTAPDGSCSVTGVLVGSGDSLLVVRGERGTITCQLSSVSTIEVQRGRRWEQISLDQPRVISRVTRGRRLGVGLCISF